MKLARRLVCAAKQQFLPLPDSLSGIRELGKAVCSFLCLLKLRLS